MRNKEVEEDITSEREDTEESEEDDKVSHFSREGGHKDDFLNNKTMIKDVPWKTLKKRLLDKTIDIDEFYVSTDNFKLIDKFRNGSHLRKKLYLNGSFSRILMSTEV